jgi:CheY-specific phosphatase CheX
MTDHLRALDAYLAISATSLFDEWGYGRCALLPCSEPEEWGEAVVAVIGFTSDHARGSIALMARPEVALALDPGSENVSPADIVGEFCNMVLGRLKNRLLARDVVLHMALPTITVGSNVRVSQNSRGQSLWHRIDIAAGTILVRLEVAFDPEFKLGTEPARTADIGREGDCLLF